ncbi:MULTISPECIES: tRNA (adenosine(37)-N6)-threonylcarbamoyltransferase complex dimerization subunit type 1 TsaB [Kocuria]|uniref:tRNA (adenosine(37)-N6)-threonylcarbamoyltransferase complex dimerization subunit type 1 TsaB n=1 Tax=Kocuria TaxID=57493 RepID=UPI0021A41AC5|nr:MULTISPECIES: tRNA (adenosine(37)-N6)-threonylcarbamoyltransferase complex dimerization subunit type 1 TsaB [Kocuria]MCT2171208.1 tRNA (adenosine(37)-N6)-threonylcarbamoyltransferase complex dimerization subunit type 1 TsaB [Kocuria rhizophila]MDN3461503.1 tRNA (adenosine(37)-N6)-threonylcarbamoyltransferase complex dimerization subunit type 1 TsaB [Kocuria sp. APC 4018]
MLVLSLDSSSIASVALSRDGEVLRDFATTDTRSHAEALAPAVRDLLSTQGVTGAELDALLVGTGPGPFTGLRAGLATARALGFAWEVPVHGLCSLDAVAHRVAPTARSAGHPEFLVAIDARRKELYWRRYRVHDDAAGTCAVPVAAPQVGAPEELPDLPCAGPGAGLYPDRIARPLTGSHELHPTAADLARAAWALTSRGTRLSTDTSPLYLRESDAKVPASLKRVTS